MNDWRHDSGPTDAGDFPAALKPLQIGRAPHGATGTSSRVLCAEQETVLRAPGTCR